MEQPKTPSEQPCRECGASWDVCIDVMLASDSRSLCCTGCDHEATQNPPSREGA
jgi:hypothetical protein